MSFSFVCRPVVLACLAALSIHHSSVLAQPAPNSGVLQEQNRQLPTLPQLGAPDVKLPAVRRAYVGGDIKVKPSAVSFSGNSLIPTAELQAVVAGLIGKDTDFNGLADAAAALRQYYASKGYVLTDVYLPEQSFGASGGRVEFAVIEARIGKVKVTAAPGSGVSREFAQALASSALVAGQPVSQYALDKPVLLLRDMAGTDAEATVLPGALPGEVDIEIAISPTGARYEPYVSLDNQGVQSSGQYRLAVGGTINAPFGMGDVFSARLQAADQSGNLLYRLGYGLAVGSYGTKLTGSYTQSEYALAKQFAALGASGLARVAALSGVQPLIRGRFTNVFATGSLEHKTLDDNISQSNLKTSKRINMLRLGLLGNHSDRTLAGATNSFAVTVAGGKLELDAASAVFDVGGPPSSVAFGPRTAGNFGKLNYELQRVQYFDDKSSVLLSLTGQLASKNLTSAEKVNLGGPQGVRGYPTGEGVGDDSVLLSVEYRFRTGFQIFGERLNLTAFYDHGKVRRDHVRNDTTLNKALTANELTLDSAGVGVLLGREGNFVLTAALAARVGGPATTTGDPEQRARLWVLMQKWF